MKEYSGVQEASVSRKTNPSSLHNQHEGVSEAEQKRVADTLESLYARRLGLQNLIEFKSQKGASEEEIDALQKSLISVEVKIASGNYLPAREKVIIPLFDDAHYSTGRVEPIPDLDTRERKIDFGGNYKGKYGASKDILYGDGDDL